MAITLADFNKIWASTSPLTPYSFSESNYKQGWNFIGSTPPARQMWDFLQKNNDEKMQYLANNYLPLTGGILTGNTGITNECRFVFNGTQNNPANSYFYNNATNGFYLETKSDNDNLLGRLVFRYTNGQFELDARNASGTAKTLLGTPDGTLTWGGNDILTSAIGCRCIKGFADGAGVFKLNVTGGAGGSDPFAAVVSFGGYNGRGFNRVFVCNGYGPGSSARTSYWRVPFPADTNDGAYAVAVASDKNEITFTKTETESRVSYTVLILHERIYGDVQFTFTPAE